MNTKVYTIMFHGGLGCGLALSNHIKDEVMIVDEMNENSSPQKSVRLFTSLTLNGSHSCGAGSGYYFSGHLIRGLKV